jgi:hypothetical protein
MRSRLSRRILPYLMNDKAQNSLMSQDDKRYYLHEKFPLDCHVAVQSVMATIKASKATYNSSLAALIELHPPIVARHKMSSLVAGKGPIKEICNNFQKGLCKYSGK